MVFMSFGVPSRPLACIYSLTSAGLWYPAVRGSQGGGVLGLLVAHLPRESPIPCSLSEGDPLYESSLVLGLGRREFSGF